MIVEAEAYIGEDDPACHAAPGPTTRNAPLYGPPGVAYVYLNYGIHYLVNAVTEAKGAPAAVLIRALEPVDGIALMTQATRACRRTAFDEAELCRGPGNLTRALGITLDENRLDLTVEPLVRSRIAASRPGTIAWGRASASRRRRAAVAMLGRRAPVGVGPIGRGRRGVTKVRMRMLRNDGC